MRVVIILPPHIVHVPYGCPVFTYHGDIFDVRWSETGTASGVLRLPAVVHGRPGKARKA